MDQDDVSDVMRRQANAPRPAVARTGDTLVELVPLAEGQSWLRCRFSDQPDRARPAVDA